MFWETLARPFFVLAPMEDVTDFVFRQIVGELGRPAVFFTEFAQARGIADNQRQSLQRLLFHPGQKPIVAQIWGNDPEAYYQAVLKIRRQGFDGVDINMGCPQPKIAAKGCCAGLIRNPRLAQELIRAAQEAASSTSGESANLPTIPVSVKTRVSYNHPPKPEGAAAWLSTILALRPAALTIHGRSAEQQSEGLADWSYVALGVDLAKAQSPTTLIIGNGDLGSLSEAESRIAATGCDGAMVGRGVFANPLIFVREDFAALSRSAKLTWALRHLNCYQDFWGRGRNYEIMKKFFKIYLSNFDDALILRESIMATHDYAAARRILVEAGALPT